MAHALVEWGSVSLQPVGQPGSLGSVLGRRGAGGIGAVRDPRFRAGAGTGLRWGSCTSAEISTYSWLRLYFQPPCCALLQGSPSGTLTHQNPLSTPKGPSTLCLLHRDQVSNSTPHNQATAHLSRSLSFVCLRPLAPLITKPQQ